MKIRKDFVTNSSAASFVITNKTNEYLTSEEVVLKLLEKIIEDARDRFTLGPGESITIVCGDASSDGAFENFIHNEIGDWYYKNYFKSDGIDVKMVESYH